MPETLVRFFSLWTASLSYGEDTIPTTNLVSSWDPCKVGE
jgi:hypothetical protein